jgi:hypothetical protein
MKSGRVVAIGFIIMAAVHFSGADAHSQEQSAFATRGIFEVGGNISFQSQTAVSNGQTSDEALQTFTRTLYFGYFVSDGFELGLNPISWRTISYGDQSLSELSFLVAPSYNFRTSGIVFPFIEGLIGYNFTSNGTDRSGLSWGGRAGIKIALVEHANIVIGVQYVQATLNASGASERSGYNLIEGAIGFSIWL